MCEYIVLHNNNNNNNLITHKKFESSTIETARMKTMKVKFMCVFENIMISVFIERMRQSTIICLFLAVKRNFCLRAFFLLPFHSLSAFNQVMCQ